MTNVVMNQTAGSGDWPADGLMICAYQPVQCHIAPVG